MRRPSAFNGFALTCLFLGCVSAATAEEAKVSYYRDVRPILQEHCQGCHQPAKPLGGLVMTSYEAIKKGGESEEPAFVPGKPDESPLLAQITPQDGQRRRCPRIGRRWPHRRSS